jgi:3'(2'), 5'-bisphosphate nucleotidase
MTQIITTTLIDQLVTLARNAGVAILSVYNDREQFSQVTFKEDDSPLTLADRASHDILSQGLRQLTPDIPVLSEEGSGIPYETRRHWEYFWCVDPLDGTKEFLNRNDAFTVNVALVHRQTPVLGVIYVPVSGSLYYGSATTGSWKVTSDDASVRIHTDDQASEWIAVRSRLHSGPEETAILDRYPVTKQITAGSALKFCLVAEGSAHLYYRHGPTMEWDTAAGHAIVEHSGGRFATLSGEPFLYNKASLVNGPFICSI